MSNKKYSDHLNKKLLWKEIAIEINQLGTGVTIGPTRYRGNLGRPS
jgi:hypothetical protein